MEVIDKAIELLKSLGIKIKALSSYETDFTIGKNVKINGIEFLILEHVAELVLEDQEFCDTFVISINQLGKKHDKK